MLVSGINIRTANGYCELRAAIKCQTFWVWGDEPFELWYRYPIELAPHLDEKNADPFLAAFLAPAMVLGETLEIDGQVSPKLLRAAHDIQALFHNWYPELRLIQVDSQIRSEAGEPAGSSRGLFFSLGADSLYSLLKNVENGAGDEAITHLITVEGFDVYLWESARYPAVLTKFDRVARELGKTPVHVTTNLRDFSDRMADWVNLYHGAALASVGLSLQKLFRNIRVSATHRTEELRPLGSHPALDHLWSTAGLSFVHDGCEAGRLDKLRRIANSRLALETLRVCAISDESDVYNCGKCPKCLMTMVGLHVAGALEACATLPHNIDLASLRAIQVTNETQRIYLTELVQALGTSNADASIKAALQFCLETAKEPLQVAAA